MKSQSGFTLLEVLVVMSLMSLVMLGLTQAVRAVGQTESRVDSQMIRAERMRIVEQLLNQTFARMDATAYPAVSKLDGKAVLLEAESDSAAWVGVMPARPGLGGRYFLRLGLMATDEGLNELVFYYVPWQSTGQFPNWEQAEKLTLLNKVTQLKIEWQGLPLRWRDVNAQWPTQWLSQWHHTSTEIPQRARFLISDDKGPWPPIVVQIWPTTRSAPTGSGFVAGGKER